MTIRKKTALIIGVTVLLLMLIQYLISRLIISRSFLSLEDQDARQHMERVQAVLMETFNSLLSTNGDWSAWDDTCTFIEGTYPQYVADNLMDVTFVNLGVNMMIFLDTSGRIVFGKAFDLKTAQAVPLPQEFQADVPPNARLWRHADAASSVAGILVLPEGPLLIASRPVLSSENQGPIRGALILGRWLDADEVQRIAQIVNLPLRLYGLSEPGLPPDVIDARAKLSADAPFTTQTLNGTTLIGYILLEDIYGKPGVLLRIKLPHEIYQQGQATIQYFLSFLFAACVVMGLVILLLLERMVLSRLALLSRSVNTISLTSDLSTRIAVPGNDELGYLAGTLNAMLATLADSQILLQKLEKAIETTEVGITITDNDGRIAYTNPADARMHGYTVEELQGCPANIFAPPDIQGAASTPQDQHDFRNWKRERINRRKDGSQFPAILISNPITDARGRSLGKVIVCEDITELKIAEAQLLAAHRELTEKNAQLAELNATKDKFFSIIAHDLRSPFTALLVLSETVLLFLDEYSKDELRENMLKIKLSTEAVSALLENLLAWSRLQRGSMPYQPKTISLPHKVAENFAIMHAHAEQKQITLENQVLSPTVAYADQAMLDTILRNLLSNALKFTAPGGVITVSASQYESVTEIAVTDTGTGMDDNTLAALFRIDVQHTQIGTAGEKGTGLGLKLCKDLVEQHGGRLWVESCLGQGTTFRFTLPTPSPTGDRNSLDNT